MGKGKGGKGGDQDKKATTVSGEVADADQSLFESETNLSKILNHLNGGGATEATGQPDAANLVSVAERVNNRARNIYSLVVCIAREIGAEL